MLKLNSDEVFCAIEKAGEEALRIIKLYDYAPARLFYTDIFSLLVLLCILLETLPETNRRTRGESDDTVSSRLNSISICTVTSNTKSYPRGPPLK